MPRFPVDFPFIRPLLAEAILDAGGSGLDRGAKRR